MPKLLFLAGSTRKDSLNKKLALLASNLSEKAGAEVTYVDLKEFEMPLYDGDGEEKSGLPDNAIKLKKLFIENDGFFIASPEYNSSIPPLVKNMIDWMSRPHEENEAPLIAFRGKIAAISAVSPGGLGGIRGLVPLRMLLGNIGVHVIPSQIAVGSGFTAFLDDGLLKDDRQAAMMQGMIDEFIDLAAKIQG